MSGTPNIDVLLCGKEVRKVRGREVILYHLQDNDLKVYTVTSKEDNNLIDDVGTEFFVPQDGMGRLKRFWSWRTDQDGLGPVRGHTITYHRWFGVQCWLTYRIP